MDSIQPNELGLLISFCGAGATAIFLLFMLVVRARHRAEDEAIRRTQQRVMIQLLALKLRKRD